MDTTELETLKSEEEEDIPEDFTCPICLELIYKPLVLPCGHSGCFWFSFPPFSHINLFSPLKFITHIYINTYTHTHTHIHTHTYLPTYLPTLDSQTPLYFSFLSLSPSLFIRCIHNAMQGFSFSTCFICRNKYNVTPSVCAPFYHYLKTAYPKTMLEREKDEIEEKVRKKKIQEGFPPFHSLILFRENKEPPPPLPQKILIQLTLLVFLNVR